MTRIARGLVAGAGAAMVMVGGVAVAHANPLPFAPTAATTYANCSQARAAGVAPIRQGEDGYSSKLDRDGDGIACE